MVNNGTNILYINDFLIINTNGTMAISTNKKTLKNHRMLRSC